MRVSLNGGRTGILFWEMRHLTKTLGEKKVALLPMKMDPKGAQWQRPNLETMFFKLLLPNSNVPK